MVQCLLQAASLNTMSGYKVSFLWLIIIFWASCHYATSDVTVGNLSVVFGNGSCPAMTWQRSNETQTDDFCRNNVQNTAVIGKCTTNAGTTFSFNITNYKDQYEVIINETLRNITLLFQSNEFLPSRVFRNLSGNNGSQYVVYVSGNNRMCVTCINLFAMKDNDKTTTPAPTSSTHSTTTPSSTSTTHSTTTPAPTSTTHSTTTPAPTSTTHSTTTPAPTSTTHSTTTPAPTSTTHSTTTPAPTSLTPSEASKLLDSLQHMADMKGTNQSKATQALNFSGVEGLLYTQAKNTQTNDLTMFYSSDQDRMSIIESQNVLQTNFSWYVKISAEAFNKSRLENNGSAYVGILLFKNMDENHTVLNNEVYGISMGANISNLTDNIEIIIRLQNLVDNASCNSWDGKGELQWTTFGCETKINKTSIKCSCSHLTFFAVLMSMADENSLTAGHVESLTYITNIGCGLSMFFLSIGLFMHFLLRKNKSNHATKILINMFVALFLLNLSFLTNESIANTQDSAACTFIALILHYSMLSTFTWFLLQALHMYLWLIRRNITIKNYMKKITVSGWVCPSPVVVIIASLGEYKSVIFKASNDKITRMCWITNHYIHYIVNIGYYSLVFIFTTGIFITIVTKIIQSRKVKVGEVKRSTFRKQLTLILSLFLLLGLTWGVAFFSYGVMTIPSYYIFCVLNSFQGFFLFLYYYHIRNDVQGRFSDDPDTSDTSATNNQSSIDTVVENVYN